MITFTRDWRGYAKGSSVGTLADTIEALAVAEGAAIYGGVAGPLNSYLDADNRVQAQVDGGGNAFLRGALTSGEWTTIPSIFRLRLTGTGTVVMDSRDSLGVETLAVASYTVTDATDQIEYPYAGDNAVAIRVTLTGTAAAEVI